MLVTIELIIVLVSSVLIGVVLGLLLVMIGRAPKMPQISVNLPGGGASGEDDQLSDDMLRIFQRGVGYPLFIEVEDRRYQDIGDIEDERARALVLTALRKLTSQVTAEELEHSVLDDVPDQQKETPALAAATNSAPASQTAGSNHFLVSQIDDVFQSILDTQPEVPDASLTAAADGSMRIKFDGHIYDEIESVPNADVKEALRTAVRRWEKRV